LSKLSSAAQVLIHQLLDEIENKHVQAFSASNSADDQASPSYTPHLIQGSLQPPPSTAHILDSIKSLSDKIDSITARQNSPAINASITSTSAPPQNYESPKSTLVIRPPNAQLLPSIASTLQSLKPPHNIKITKLKINSNKIELRTTTETDKNTLRDYLQNNLPKDLPIEDKNPSTTKIIFFDVPDTTLEEEFIQAIKTKLGISDDHSFSFTLIKKIMAKREGHEHWTALLTRRLALSLLPGRYILLGLRRVFFRRHVQVRRCTKCQGLNKHFASSCKAKSHYCSECGGPHHFSNCTASIPNCVNCADFNNTYRQDGGQVFDIHHSAASSACPYYRLLFNQLLMST
jgi:hypothetical protein